MAQRGQTRMKKQFGMGHRFEVWCRTLVFLLAAGFLVANISPASQTDKKEKKDEGDSSKTTLLSEEQQIEFMLYEMMGAWQGGDVEKLHPTSAEEGPLVSGSRQPP